MFDFCFNISIMSRHSLLFIGDLLKIHLIHLINLFATLRFVIIIIIILPVMDGEFGFFPIFAIIFEQKFNNLLQLNRITKLIRFNG